MSREEIEKKNNDKRNVPVLVITYIVVILFVSMMAYLVKYVAVDSETTIANPYNTRQNLYAKKVIKAP